MMEGNRARRPLPQNEPRYETGVPVQPSGMSLAAKKIWLSLVSQMLPSGVLRVVDAFALAQLCEDQAMLDNLRRGMEAMAQELSKQAKAKKQMLPGGPMVALSRTVEGRRTLSTIREVSAQIILQRREFGLTPASNSRVHGAGPGTPMDPLEAALCG